MAREGGVICTYMADSQCCTQKGTQLDSNYVPIKKKKKSESEELVKESFALGVAF